MWRSPPHRRGTPILHTFLNRQPDFQPCFPSPNTTVGRIGPCPSLEYKSSRYSTCLKLPKNLTTNLTLSPLGSSTAEKPNKTQTAPPRPRAGPKQKKNALAWFNLIGLLCFFLSFYSTFALPRKKKEGWCLESIPCFPPFVSSVMQSNQCCDFKTSWCVRATWMMIWRSHGRFDELRSELSILTPRFRVRLLVDSGVFPSLPFFCFSNHYRYCTIAQYCECMHLMNRQYTLFVLYYYIVCIRTIEYLRKPIGEK